MQPILDWYMKVIRDYANFSGRAGRAEFWYFALVNFVVYCILAFLARIMWPLVFLEFVYSLAVLVPSIAVTVRRLHDTNKSGWFVLIGLIPFLGAVILLVLCILEGDAADNQYGPPPNESTVPVAAG